MSAKVAAAIAAVLMSATFAEAVMLCEETKGSSKHYWSWRIIDGKKCWYPGRPGKPKSELQWEVIDASIPELPSEGKHPEVDSAALAFDPPTAPLVASIAAPPVGKVHAESLGPAEDLKPPPVLPSRVTERRAEHEAGWSWLWIFIPPAAYAAWATARKTRTRNSLKGGFQGGFHGRRRLRGWVAYATGMSAPRPHQRARPMPVVSAEATRKGTPGANPPRARQVLRPDHGSAGFWESGVNSLTDVDSRNNHDAPLQPALTGWEADLRSRPGDAHYSDSEMWNLPPALRRLALRSSN
jgi:hypothetical protein